MRILTDRNIAALIDLDQIIVAVEDAMAMHARKQVIEPDLLHAEGRGGEFHIKIGGLLGEGQRPVFGLKANGGFFHNRERHDLPNILGVIYLADAETGAPLAVLDSVEISRQRTGAASAIAAKHLALEDAKRIGVIGAGAQARVQLDAIGRVRQLEGGRVWARDSDKAAQFAARVRADYGITLELATTPDEAVAEMPIVVTTTPATSWLVSDQAIAPGTFIAAVGADSPGKQELEPALMRRAKIVADVSSQVIRVGETQHVIADNSLTPADLHAQLGEVIVGARPGREDHQSIFVYDSTGTALQDVAAALAVLRIAINKQVGQEIRLGS